MGKIIEILNGRDSCEELNKLRDEIDKFVALILDDYVSETKRYVSRHSLSPDNTKNFYDSVWGTIEINEGEIFILNSPVLQRLRNIKQLGLVDLLYSSANHTRFSHTLGVLQTSSLMWKQIERELQKKRADVEEDTEQIIRLAAIFHDAGHMFCSHASERYFQNELLYSRQKDIERIRNHFNKKIEHKPALTEIISVLIVCSKSVQELISTLDRGFQNLNFDNNKQEVITEKICCLILGFPYSKNTIPYSQVISGQIDSDKLDYLRRDSHGTGVPVAVDMSRVFQKLRMVKTKQDFQMLSEPQEETHITYKMGIAPAAINTVDQLMISRYMMFENVYFHQKVLTAEEMLRYALRKIDSCTTGLLDNFQTIMQITDATIVNKHFEKSVHEIESFVGHEFSIKDEEAYNEACRILADIYSRKLFKRCFSFTADNMTNTGREDSAFYTKVFIKKDNKYQETFLKRVIDEVQTIKDLLDEDGDYCRYTDVLLVIAPEISTVSFNSNIAIADKKKS